jgi:hypothetical protein
MKYFSVLFVIFVAAFLLIPMSTHNVEFVVMGDGDVRFQHANGTPMANAEVRVIGEHMRPIAIARTNEYGIFNYRIYFGSAARLEVNHNGYTVNFVVPEVSPLTVISDRGVRLETIVPAGSGGRLSAASRSFIYISIAFVVVFIAMLIANKVRGKTPIATKSQIVHSRRFTPHTAPKSQSYG